MQALKGLLKNQGPLPPTPRVVPELMRLLNQPDVDSSKIVNMISCDQALTASVLRIANSAYFGSSLPTEDLQEAVTRLGFQQVYKLVAAATGARLLSPAQIGYGLEQGELWKHSVASAVAAQIVARELGDNENLVFTASLLHDIGKTILSNSLKAEQAKIARETEGDGSSMMEIETKLFGVNHAEAGGQLLQHWNFPPNIVGAVWFHHAPKGAGVHQRLASCVYVGNLIASCMGHTYGRAGFAVRARAEAMATLELTPRSIPNFIMETYGQMELIDALFSLAA